MAYARVMDRAKLARVFQYIERWEGSRQKAAERMGIGAVTFWRLRKRKGGPHLSAKSFNALYRYRPPHDAPNRTVRRFELALDAAVMPPAAKDAFFRYKEWLTWWFRGLRTDRGSRLIELRGRLRRHKSYIAYFETFENAQKKRGYLPTGHRVVLAELRAVRPLLDSDDTAGIEQGWKELDRSKTLGRYLKSALTAESVLLDRVSASERAREVTS